jgi:tetratricopeptide (TPR) repeat protein
MIEQATERAEILIQQKRYAEAEKILNELLGNDPNNVYILTLLTEACLQLDKNERALTIVETAIGLAPDNAIVHYMKARAVLSLDRYNDAEQCLATSISLEPDFPSAFAFWASIKLIRKQYQSALEMADKALALEPDNVLALNNRSTALVKLNQTADAYATIDGALREDPNNYYTHANYGWTLLEKGQHKKALEHFRESLKINPGFEYAQAGMIEALKAKNPVYRLFLKYAFFMGNLTQKYQWGVIIGLYLLLRLLGSLADKSPQLAPYITPITFLLIVFAFSTWIIAPLSNLYLRLNRFGRYILSPKETKVSNYVGVSLLVCLAALPFYFANGNEGWLALSAFGFVMMLPLSVMLSPAKRKYILVAYTLGLALVGLLAVAGSFVLNAMFNNLSMVFLIALFAFQWVANFMLIKQGNV